jgi:replicative DNA helicase
LTPKATISFVTLESAVLKLIEEGGSAKRLLKTRLPGIDRAIGGGVAPGEMVIIAGRPSHGKTVVGMQALSELAAKVPVLLISEEMGLSALAQRQLSTLTELEETAWENSKEWLKELATQHFRDRKYLVVESCGTVDKAIAAIEEAKAKHGIAAVAVDYVQLLRGQGEGRYEQISNVSTMLKQVAVRCDVVLLAICQLNRGIENRSSNTTAKMSDLRDSGQLEQDADVILFVEWLCRSNPQAHTEEEYRIIVAKNRNRPINDVVVKCRFIKHRQMLVENELVPIASTNPNYYSEFEPSHEEF